MPTLLYIHGFLSSPLSFKAQQVRDYCEQMRPDWRYLCPQLEPYPQACAEALHQIASDTEGPLYIIGSSMGGFWATWLAEQFTCRAVLVNPAVNVLDLFPAYLNKPLKNYHHEEIYRMSEADLNTMAEYCIDRPSHPSRLWLMVQEGDETLDYRLAVEKYQACRQTVEPLGDHSFQHFDRHLDAIMTFFEAP